jgi:anti-sigma B factor antagonist
VHVPQLMIRLRPPSPPAPAVAAVSGDVDRCNASMLGQQLDGVLDDGLVLDVSGVDFLDLGGLRAMLALDAQLRRTGRRLVLASPPCPVRLLLDNVALDDPLDTSPTVEQAVARASTRDPLEPGP